MKKIICLACFALAGCSFGGSGNNGKNPSPADSARVIDVGKQQTTREAVERGAQAVTEPPRIEPDLPSAAELTPNVNATAPASNP